MDNVTTKIERFMYDAIYLLLWLVETILLLRFALELLGGNPYNVIVSFIYSLSSVFMDFFNGIFASSHIGNMTLDPSVLVAIVFYAIVAYLLVSLLEMIHKNNANSTGAPT